VKRFEFRLERVLRVRRVLDQQARQVLAAAIADRVSAEAGLADLRRVVRDRIREMDALQTSGDVDVRRVLRHEADLVLLGRDIDRAEETLEEAEVYEAECADALAEARRQVEVVEKLREKELRAHTVERQREEMGERDEHVARRYAVHSVDSLEAER